MKNTRLILKWNNLLFFIVNQIHMKYLFQLILNQITEHFKENRSDHIRTSSI